MEELKEIIEKLEKRNNPEEAYFGFYHEDDDPDDQLIKANREGLELYALDLLRAARETYDLTEKENPKTYWSDVDDFDDENSHFSFDRIKVFKGTKQEIDPSLQKPKTWKEKASDAGCLGLVLLIIALILIGLKTVGSWF